MENHLSHKVSIKIEGDYPHGHKQYAEVVLSGDGCLEHMIKAFKTALLADGFDTQIIDKFVTDP